MNVLVVDDDPFARNTISLALQKGGYEVFTADNGQAAFDLIHRHHFQILVTDWQMPQMTGLELCRRIRAMRLPGYVYCILVTCRNRQGDRLSGFAEGIDDYVIKPFDPRELLMRVEAGRRVVQLETANMTILALAKLAESRDPEAGSHLENVRNYCRVLATYLQGLPQYAEMVDDKFIDLIYRTSPLHDIGKVAIPDAILLKPGPLSAEEFEVMKTHTLRGAETVESVLSEFPHTDFLQLARDLILTHHEKWNGTGYPLGLSGEQIPLCGRIMAVADVYDALTSKRVYKPAYQHENAKSIIVQGSGSHFDPDLVDAFLKVEQEFIAIQSQQTLGVAADRVAADRPAPGIVPPPPRSRWLGEAPALDDFPRAAISPQGVQHV